MIFQVLKNNFPTRREFIKVSRVNVYVLLIILFALEFCGQLMYQLKDGNYPIVNLFFAESSLFEPDALLTVVPQKNIVRQKKNKKISFNNFGQRISSSNLFSPIDFTKKRIVCIGGSTTFGTHLTDEATYPFLLQEKLNEDFQVFNLGVPGYSTLEAIAQMKTIVQDIKPDMIIHYQGWNDIHNYHLPNNLPDFQTHKMMLKNALIPKQYTSECFAIKKFANSICNFLRKKETIIPLEIADQQVDSAYQVHLQILQDLGEKMEAQLIFVPQVLNLKNFYTTAEQRHWTPYIKNDCMPDLISKFNLILENTIQENENTVVVKDILTAYDWNEEDFVDEGHFSKKGNEKFVNILLDKIKILKTDEEF